MHVLVSTLSILFVVAGKQRLFNPLFISLIPSFPPLRQLKPRPEAGHEEDHQTQVSALPPFLPPSLPSPWRWSHQFYTHLHQSSPLPPPSTKKHLLNRAPAPAPRAAPRSKKQQQQQQHPPSPPPHPYPLLHELQAAQGGRTAAFPPPPPPLMPPHDPSHPPPPPPPPHPSSSAAAPSSRQSSYRGVFWNSTAGRWRACISVGNLSRSLGYFQTDEAAALAYDKAAREFHVNPVTNFLDDGRYGPPSLLPSGLEETRLPPLPTWGKQNVTEQFMLSLSPSLPPSLPPSLSFFPVQTNESSSSSPQFPFPLPPSLPPSLPPA